MNPEHKITLSPLGHTWILDLDGTLVAHNGYKIDGNDFLLAGVSEFISSLPASDMIIIITARKESERENTINFLTENKLRYDHIIFDAPYGERILVNDRKPGGLDTAKAVNLNRNQGINFSIELDRNL